MQFKAEEENGKSESCELSDFFLQIRAENGFALQRSLDALKDAVRVTPLDKPRTINLSGLNYRLQFTIGNDA